MSDEGITEEKDDILPIEVGERGSEYPIIDFNNYAEVCNYQNDGARLRGILSSELYETIVEDPSTSFIKSGDRRIPVLMDVSYGPAMGYDTTKCEEYAKDLSTNIRILTLPIHELNDDEKNQLASVISSSGNFALYFSDHNSDELNALADILDKIGANHLEKPLTDSRAAKGDEQAAVLLFSCLVEQNSSRGERKKLRLSDVQDYYEKNIGPYITPDGESKTMLEMGDKISDEEAEEMWELFNNRFNFLGENHPLSMQDSKEDFLKLLRMNSTLIASTYTKGETGNLDKLTCFTYFIDDMGSLYWLNQRYLAEKFSTQEGREYVTDIYTPGLVSSGMGRSYSALSIGLYAKAGDESGLSTNVLFENTNLSKKYIPRIVNSAIKNSCKYSNLTPSYEVDKEEYRLWVIGTEAE
jgi:hypothetical protein